MITYIVIQKEFGQKKQCGIHEDS